MALMDPDASDEMTDHLVDFFDQVAPAYDSWAGGQPGRVAGRLAVSCQRRSLSTRAQDLFFQGLAPMARRHYLSLPRYSSERSRFGEPNVLPKLLDSAGFKVDTMTEMVMGGRAQNAREWTDLMAGARPLPYTLINALGPRHPMDLEAEVQAAMDSPRDPDAAFRYHHSDLMAVATKPCSLAC